MELLGKELPASVVAHSFRSDQDIFANEVHGTACAEIICDMAPNTRLWLVNFSTDLGAPGADNQFGPGRISLFKKSTIPSEIDRSRHKFD